MLLFRFGVLLKKPIVGVILIENMCVVFYNEMLLGSSVGMVLILIFVFVGGMFDLVCEWLVLGMEEMGFVVVVGGGIFGELSELVELCGGLFVGVEFVCGDLWIVVIGMVMLVEDDIVYVFGYLFLGSGWVEMLMVLVLVIYMLVDFVGFVKFLNVGGEVGVIVDDCLGVVVGCVGVKVWMILVWVFVSGVDYDDVVYNYEMICYLWLSLLLVGVIVVSFL